MSPDLSRAAGTCPVVVAAVRLAEWISEDGVPVTPGGSLRPADVPTASAALGILTRAKIRRAADVPEVHRPWLTAIAAGLIIITDGRAVRADRLEDPFAARWTGLQALLTVEAADTIGVDPRITTTVTMDVVTREHLHDSWDLQHRVGRPHVRPRRLGQHGGPSAPRPRPPSRGRADPAATVRRHRGNTADTTGRLGPGGTAEDGAGPDHPRPTGSGPAGATGRHRRGRRLEPGLPLVRRPHQGTDRGGTRPVRCRGIPAKRIRPSH